MSGIEENFLFGSKLSNSNFSKFAQSDGGFLDLDSNITKYMNYEFNQSETNIDENSYLVQVETSFWSQGAAMMDLGPEEEPDIRLAFTSTSNFLMGLLMLFLMVAPWSIIGPLTISLPAHDPYVKTSWSNHGWTLVAIPFWVLLYMFKWEEMSFWNDFQISILLKNFLSAFWLFAWNTGLMLGWSMTLTSHADIMYSSSGVYILFFTLITWNPIHILELFGYFLYFCGVYLMFTDESATKTGMNGQSYLGDLYAFIGAGFWAWFSYLNQSNDEMIHPLVTLTQMFIFSSIQQMMVFPFLVSTPSFFSFDVQNGAFGWLVDWNAFYLVAIINAPLTGMIGNFGFYSAYYYWPMQMVAGTMLMEPFLAQLAGIILGQDEVPGYKTLAGWLIITAGFLISSFGTRYKSMNKTKSKESFYSLEGGYNKLDD